MTRPAKVAFYYRHWIRNRDEESVPVIYEGLGVGSIEIVELDLDATRMSIGIIRKILYTLENASSFNKIHNLLEGYHKENTISMLKNKLFYLQQHEEYLKHEEVRKSNWTTADGRVIAIKDLTDTHLNNIVLYIRRRIDEYDDRENVSLEALRDKLRIMEQEVKTRALPEPLIPIKSLEFILNEMEKNHGYKRDIRDFASD